MRPCGQLTCVREMSVDVLRKDHEPHVGAIFGLVKWHKTNRLVDYFETFESGRPILRK